MRDTTLASIGVPLALIVLMLALGLTLDVRDFGRVVRGPRAVVVGVVAQLVLLPLLGVGVAKLSGLAPLLGLGFVLVTLCPGGALSNTICHLVRADVPLSVSLTAISSVVAPFSLPVLYAGVAKLWPEAPELHLPILPTMGRLLAVSVVPIVVGIGARRRAAVRVASIERSVRAVSVVLFAAVVLGVVGQNLDALRSGVRELGGTALVLCLAAMGLGLGAARLTGLSRRAAVTLGIEVGMQNVATATFVTVTLVGKSALALPAAVYALVALVGSLGLGLIGRRWSISDSAPPREALPGVARQPVK